MNIFKLFGEIAINNQGANQAINDTSSRAHSLGDKMGKVFTSVGNGAIKCGKVIGTGLAAGATAMTGLVVKGMNLLSGLEQNLGGSEAVFGEFAKRMQDTAAQAYSNMGLSQSAYLATANKMGSLFKGAGFATVEAVELTEETMQRAADVASIMGIDIEHAMESIAGAAKGNFSMMDNLGVAINETNLQEYALSKGIRKTTQEMTTQEKVALAMQMFMEKTAYAAGNYAKENDTLAGALTTAKAAFQNFLSGAGDEDEVASALENAATVIGKKLNVLLPKLSQGIGGLIKKLSPRIPALMKDFLPGVIDGATNMLTGIADAIPALLSAAAETLPGAISRMWENIRQTAPVLLSALEGVINSVDFTKVGTAIGDGIRYVINNIPAIMRSIGRSLSNGWKTIVWPIVQGFAISFGIDLPDWKSTKAYIQIWWKKIDKSINGLFKAIFSVGTEDADGKTVAERITLWWKNVLKAVGDVFKATFAVEPEAWDEVTKRTLKAWEETVKPALEKVLKLIIGVDVEFPTAGSLADKFNEWVLNSIPNLPEEARHFFKLGDKSFAELFEDYSKAKQLGLGVGANDKNNGTNWDEVKVIDVTEPTDSGAGYGDNGRTGASGTRSGTAAKPTKDYTLDYFSFFSHENSITRSGDYLSQAIAQMNGESSNNAGQIINLLSAILTATNRPIVLDTGALVGAMGGQINAQLGRTFAQSTRRW